MAVGTRIVVNEWEVQGWPIGRIGQVEGLGHLHGNPTLVIFKAVRSSTCWVKIRIFTTHIDYFAGMGCQVLLHPTFLTLKRPRYCEFPFRNLCGRFVVQFDVHRLNRGTSKMRTTLGSRWSDMID